MFHTFMILSFKQISAVACQTFNQSLKKSYVSTALPQQKSKVFSQKIWS